MSIYNTAVNKPISTLMVFLAIMVLGVASYIQLPVDQYPKMDPPYITVMATYPGANAADIEENVAKILEDQLNSVDDLKEMTSTSYDNLAVISLEFEWEVNLDEASNDVRDAVDKAMNNLPDDIDRPTIMRFNTSMMPILIYAVTAEESYPGIDKILDDKLITRLNRVDGVASVNIAGSPVRVVYVDLDPNKLDAYNLTLEQIGNKILTENRDISSGNVKMGDMDYTLRVEGEFDESDQIKNLVLGTQNNKTIYLHDVATVRDTLKDITLEQTINRGNGGVLMVTKQTDANAVAVANQAKKEIEKAMKELPSDIKFQIISDNSDFIVKSINNLQESLMYALIFVILIVFLFLGRWRATFIIALTIPISLIVAFIYLFATGESLNIISLSSLSIAIGMVVDDAIVVLENVTTHIERGSDPKQAAVHGTNEVAISVIASTLTMIAVFFPLTMVSGMSGVMFKQLGWMMCAIMFISTVSALSLTPMLCAQLLKLQKKQSKAFTMFYRPIEKSLDGLDNWYARMLNWSVRHRSVIVIGCIVFFVASLFCAKGIGTEFFPAQDNARIAVKLELPIGTRKELAQEISEKLTNYWLEHYKGIMKVCNYTVGQADSDNTFASMQDNGSHIISFNISLVDPGDRDITLEQVCDEMREELKKYPEFSKAQVILGGSNTGMSAQASADFEIYGYDMATTDSVAARLKRQLLDVKGVSEVNISRSDYQPEYQVDFDREKLALHGLNLSTAATYLRNRINGAVASKYREDGDEYDIKVRYAPEYRTSLESLENILVYNAKGEAVRIKDLGTVVERFAPPTIERKDRERIVTVSAVISGAPLGDVVNAGNAIIDKMEMPSEVTIQVAGSYEDQQDSFRDLGTLAVLIVILVFIVMAAQFESLTYPFIIMFSLPFAFSGVLMALFFTNSTLSVMSLLGAIMLIGIVVKNGIVLIDYITLCRERGQSVLHSVVTAGKSRLRPVLMTTATTVLGMIPMAVGGGQGSEMWSPMAIAVIGGLTVSTILTLVLIPTLYCIFAGTGIKHQRKVMKRKRELDVYFEAHKDEIIKK